jgi:hypothetical protein
MTTTTLAAIVANYVTKLEALTPTSIGGRFLRTPLDYTLDEWAGVNQGSASLRRFEFVETGGDEDLGVMDPSASLRRRELTLTVAYPRKGLSLYGKSAHVDLESIAEADARQLRDALFSSGNYVTGQELGAVTVLPLDRNDGSVWFQRLVVVVEHYATQTLT